MTGNEMTVRRTRAECAAGPDHCLRLRLHKRRHPYSHQVADLSLNTLARQYISVANNSLAI